MSGGQWAVRIQNRTETVLRRESPSILRRLGGKSFVSFLSSSKLTFQHCPPSTAHRSPFSFQSLLRQDSSSIRFLKQGWEVVSVEFQSLLRQDSPPIVPPHWRSALRSPPWRISIPSSSGLTFQPTNRGCLCHSKSNRFNPFFVRTHLRFLQGLEAATQYCEFQSLLRQDSSSITDNPINWKAYWLGFQSPLRQDSSSILFALCAEKWGWPLRFQSLLRKDSSSIRASLNESGLSGHVSIPSSSGPIFD